MGKTRLKEIRRLIREECKAIGKHRDKLRTLHDELTDMLDATGEGLELIEDGIGKLSEQV
jgi:uncharacterized coiled-coil protein SlyX